MLLSLSGNTAGILTKRNAIGAMTTSTILTTMYNSIEDNNNSSYNNINNSKTMPSDNETELSSTGIEDEKIAKLNTTQAKGEITELSTNVTLFMQKIPRLQVHWKDNLPNGTTYNVLVSAVNSTRCPDAPCSEYTIKQKPSKYIYLPQSPNPSVESVDCNYMFGCMYNVTVETSNLLVRRSMRVLIPYCVAGKCSCQLSPTPPKVLARATMQTNDTISINFTILANEQLRKEQENHLHEALKAYKMQLRINEESNPSLPWGGVLKNLHNRIYNLNELHFRPIAKGYDGHMQLTLGTQLKEKASLNLQAVIIDPSGCEGQRSVIKVPVPAKKVQLNNDANLSNSLIIMITLIIAITIVGFITLLLRRRRAKTKEQLKKNQIYLESFAVAPVEMEDNINYVDKYVEQSQALGLADIFEVPHSAIHMGQMLGEGAFGQVHEATAINLRRMRGTTLVAVKQLKANPSADEVDEFLSEIEMLKGVGTHNNVVCFLGCCTIRAPYLMIMEYVGRGNLLNYLRTARQQLGQSKTRDANHTTRRIIKTNSSVASSLSASKPQSVNYIELKASSPSTELEQSSVSISSSSNSNDLCARQAKPSFAETTYTIVEEEEEPFEYILDHKELHNFALQIANGMRFLEEQEITHRDLAARNVLIDGNKTLKISDFGLSRRGLIYTNTKTRKLPLRWLSIEAIRDNVYSSKSDIWAYGVVLWEIGTLGASPYPTISNSELIPFLMAGNRLERPEICTPQVYTIMLQCWLEEAKERPTFDALCKVLSPKTTYVDINSLSDDYVFPPIKE
ncbi:GH11264 [Drosophila grimshawi]|uniref:GH11264 n=2 Tax=Drosophila grimshawi TaxID=7222 RepID=B4JDX2_DROGR|nr:GH11264 [Drosophila grimshawi]